MHTLIVCPDSGTGICLGLLYIFAVLVQRAHETHDVIFDFQD